MNTQKVAKDVKTLTDLVLMKEIRDTNQAIQHYQQKMGVLTSEMNRRIEAGDVALKDEEAAPAQTGQ
jgi:hypothetical protein